MRSITVLRVEADSGVVGRVLGKLPGVEVVESVESVEADEATPTEQDSPESVPIEEAEDSDGLLAGVAPEDGIGETVTPETDLVDEDTASLVRQYGLLGAGVTLVLAGVASVGAWVYQRRKAGEAETPPPAEPFEPEPTVGETPAPSGASDTVEPVSPATEPDDESAGRVEGDRTDVEWTTRDRTAFDADTDEDEEIEPAEPRPGESVDPAPLLGVAFVALSGALVRWLRAGEDEQQGPTG